MLWGQVNDKLQVEGHKNWFAIGDCNNLPEVKLGYRAKMQAELLAKTLTSIVQLGPEAATWATHKPNSGMQVCPSKK